jgi:hypothetical protein
MKLTSNGKRGRLIVMMGWLTVVVEPAAGSWQGEKVSHQIATRDTPGE